MVKGRAEKDDMSMEHEASMDCHEVQAAALASKEAVLPPLVLGLLAVVDAEAVLGVATTSPARAQGLVGMVLPPSWVNSAGEAVERWARQVSRALSKTAGFQTEEL